MAHLLGEHLGLLVNLSLGTLHSMSECLRWNRSSALEPASTFWEAVDSSSSGTWTIHKGDLGGAPGSWLLPAPVLSSNSKFQKNTQFTNNQTCVLTQFFVLLMKLAIYFFKKLVLDAVKMGPSVPQHRLSNNTLYWCKIKNIWNGTPFSLQSSYLPYSF